MCILQLREDGELREGGGRQRRDVGLLEGRVELGEEATALLRAEVDAALQAGVFGSPSVVVDGEPFWGIDKFEQIDRWLTRGGW